MDKPISYTCIKTFPKVIALETILKGFVHRKETDDSNVYRLFTIEQTPMVVDQLTRAIGDLSKESTVSIVVPTYQFKFNQVTAARVCENQRPMVNVTLIDRLLTQNEIELIEASLAFKSCPACGNKYTYPKPHLLQSYGECPVCGTTYDLSLGVIPK